MHRWRQWEREGGPRRPRLSLATSVTPSSDGFVPAVVSDTPTGAEMEEIHIEGPRGARALIAVRWPVSAAVQRAVWLLELLHYAR